MNQLICLPFTGARTGRFAMKSPILHAALALSGAALAVCVLGVGACAPAATPPVADNAEQAPASEPPERMSFIVKFRPSHALGQAQALQNAGRHEAAARLVSVTLREDSALRGLCFEGFTLGAAEIVLNVCAPDPWEEPHVTRQRWLEQLGATTGVAYVDRNFAVYEENTAEAGAP